MKLTTNLNITSIGLTDVGQKRSNNQDSIFVSNDETCCIVADGMGGHKGGDAASQMAVSVIPKNILTDKKTSDCSNDKLKKSIETANLEIFNLSSQDKTLEGMGTTVVMFVFDQKDNLLRIANVGDSRLYLISDKTIFQLTKDNSLIQEKLNLGLYNRKAALKDNQKNVLIKTVGFEETTDVDIYSFHPRADQFLLLCSDGLHGMLTDQEMLNIVNKYYDLKSKSNNSADNVNDGLDNTITDEKAKLKIICQNLIDAANKNGGTDNISSILSHFSKKN